MYYKSRWSFRDHDFGNLKVDSANRRTEIQTSSKKIALEFAAAQEYLDRVPSCGLSSTAKAHTAYREAWCRIRRSPDHSLAGAFCFPGAILPAIERRDATTGASARMSWGRWEGERTRKSRLGGRIYLWRPSSCGSAISRRANSGRKKASPRHPQTMAGFSRRPG